MHVHIFDTFGGQIAKKERSDIALALSYEWKTLKFLINERRNQDEDQLITLEVFPVLIIFTTCILSYMYLLFVLENKTRDTKIRHLFQYNFLIGVNMLSSFFFFSLQF